ncbi:hypothetical protein, partial [Streptococcus sp. SS-4456]|uniref:hypothetical protein n=1 Tax=Streptococcus sp. SS-4456 TaxID=3072286 RepID=UPI002FC9134A
DGVVSALKQPFFSKNSKKDKHQNDVCLQSETSCLAGSLRFYPTVLHSPGQTDNGYFQFSQSKVFSLHLVLALTIWEIVRGGR